jgi:hypothetical protein
LDKLAPGAVEYIKMDFRIPPAKKPAEAYYFVNVLGRNQLIDWELSLKNRQGTWYFLDGLPAQWVMKSPNANDPAVWHEADRLEGDITYAGDGYRVFVTNALGDALNAAFPGQCRLVRIKENLSQ